jgi:hypothetical protein
MPHTEIPTDLLKDVFELFEYFKREAKHAEEPEIDLCAITVRQYQPLAKWLEYIGAVWADQGRSVR